MKSSYLKTIGLVVGSIVLMSGSCEDKEITCNDVPATYTNEIKPIIDKNCTECHEGFGSYAGLQGVIQNGEFEHEVIEEREMPPSGKLSNEELILIKCWLDNGAAE